MVNKKFSYKKWYKEPENKKYMNEYMKKYYLENKEQIKLNTSERLNKLKYNNPKKNKVRENIIKILKENKIKRLLTLESKDFLMVKLIPEVKTIVFEKDKKEFSLMEKKTPKNINLFYGDISKFSDLNSKVDCIYLDFCTNWTGAKETIFSLKENIKECKIFGLTLTIRDNQICWNGDYQFDLINRLQELLEINLKVIYGEAYQDTMGMVTIFFKIEEI